MLVARIGSARAGYATVLFPIVALTASTLLEGYRWTGMAIMGVVLACAGNVVMFKRRGTAPVAERDRGPSRRRLAARRSPSGQS